MPAPNWTPPTEFEEYRLTRRLGHGSMGQVWLAHDLLLDRLVAIKFIGSLTGQTTLRERFLNEARAIARLAHPNVVTVHRIGTLENQPFMVSEFIEGQSLDQLPRPLEPERALQLGIDLARGLGAAHRAGILHRDVKPANTMLTRDGVAKLLDFGLAKFGADALPANDAAGAPAIAVPAPNDPNATPLPDVDSAATVASLRPPGASAAAASLTQHGAILGTPLYMAPECWRGEAATRRSDVYSLGALLYELCAGQAPVRFLPAGELDQVVTSVDPRPLLEVAPRVGEGLGKVIDRCLHRDVALRFASGDELREALERLKVSAPRQLPAGNPYRGLAAFDAEHQALFFGREAEARTACDRLRERSLVVIAGESGVGKSSLARAAVLPMVQAGVLSDGRAWTVVPCLPGRHPLRSLAAACASALGLEEEALHQRVASEPGTLARACLQALGPGRGLLVFVDQLEEWVTFGEQSEAACAALALASLCEGLPGLRVLATARIDLLSRLSTLPGIGAELGSGLLLLGPVQREQLHQVVVRPAETFGVRFESPELVERFVKFALEGGALPLLQFALARLWESRGSSEVLTEASLEKMGGVSGALSQHADGVVASMPAEQRLAARALLLSLVSANDRRRRRPEAELVTSEVHKAALATLSNARLVLARDSAEGTVWEIAHEALLREWPTLVQWLDDDAEGRALRDKLGAATTEWERLGRSPDALWGERQLQEAERVLGAAPPDQQLVRGEAEPAFLAASRRAVRLKKIRVPLAIVAVLFVTAAAFGTVRWFSLEATRARAQEHLVLADGHLASAKGARSAFDVVRAEAFDAFDRGDWPAGEERWARALATREQWERHLGLARAETDTAQLLMPSHAGLPARLVVSAEQRIAFDEAVGHEPELEAEVRRLQALGAPADQLAKLAAPARVTVKVTPPGATVTLAQYEVGAARARLGTPSPVTAGAPLELKPGSYQLELSAPGHRAASLPFVARRGAALALEVKLLEDDRVPEGYVHVPGGWSLVGSAADESVRREFYEAAPLHAVFVDDFLIARHEVTFRDWLAWLAVLPEAERAARTPRIDSSLGTADTANLHLEASPAGWSISFKPVTQRYTAREGEPIVYRDRKYNAEQRWLEMPVVGVSPLDVEAYAAWLNASGRVPGARVCREYEWERAARGADGRTLPHGEVVGPDDADIDETYGRQDAAFGPDEVGRHPGSRSPFGVDDLLGNVWEIVRPTSSAKQWANKGGSWQVNALSARTPNQWVINPGYRQVETGARLCARVP